MAQTPPDVLPRAPFLSFGEVVEEWVDEWFGVLDTLLSTQRTLVKATLGAAVANPGGLINGSMSNGAMSQRLTAQTADERAPVS